MWPHGMVFYVHEKPITSVIQKVKMRKCYNIDNIPSYAPTEMNFIILFPLWKDLRNTYLIPHLWVYLSDYHKMFHRNNL